MRYNGRMTSSENQDDPARTTASTRDERIQSPHDRLINQTLQQAEAARELLARHLPSEVVQHLKLGTLVPVDTSFIDRNLRRRFADRLFSVEVSDEIVRSLKMRSNNINVLVLIDFAWQS